MKEEGRNTQWILCQLKSIPGKSKDARREESRSSEQKEEGRAATPADPKTTGAQDLELLTVDEQRMSGCLD